MAHQTYGDADERWNRVNDDDALWGPFADIRPAKNQEFSSLRAFIVSAAVGGFFGLALDLIWALSAGRASLPSVYAMPVLLTLAYFVGFQLTLVPAWNRRAYWLRRREEYLAQSST